MREPSPAQLTKLVARRELTEQLRSKTFRVITLLLVVAVGAVVLVPAAIGNGETTQIVGVVGGTSPGIEHAAVLAGKVAGIDHVYVQSMPSEAAARKGLKDGSIDVALIDEQVILLKKEPTAGVDANGTTLAEALAQLIGRYLLHRACAGVAGRLLDSARPHVGSLLGCGGTGSGPATGDHLAPILPLSPRDATVGARRTRRARSAGPARVTDCCPVGWFVPAGQAGAEPPGAPSPPIRRLVHRNGSASP